MEAVAREVPRTDLVPLVRVARFAVRVNSCWPAAKTCLSQFVRWRISHAKAGVPSAAEGVGARPAERSFGRVPAS